MRKCYFFFIYFHFILIESMFQRNLKYITRFVQISIFSIANYTCPALSFGTSLSRARRKCAIYRKRVTGGVIRYRGLLTGTRLSLSLSRHVIKRQVSHAALVDAASWSNFAPPVARRGFSAWRRIYRFYGPSIETASVSLRSRILFPSRILSGCRALAPPGLSGIPREVFIIISTEVRSLISNWTSGSHRGNKTREGGGRGSVEPLLLRC